LYLLSVEAGDGGNGELSMASPPFSPC
jgi:hypothetical protein